MEKLFFILLFLFAFWSVSGCSLPEREWASIEAGDTFVDETPPSLRIEFPFPISIVKQESSIEGGEDGLRIYVTNYALKQLDAVPAIYISRQSLPESDGHFSSFRGADEALIQGKIYLEKFVNGFCTVNEEKINNYNFLVITIVRYSWNKQADILRLYDFIPEINSYNQDLKNLITKNSF